MHILVVEDNRADARLIQTALRGDPLHQVSIVEDGVTAMAWLHREEPYAHVPRPDLIVLDLNVPRKDGRTVLAECKADPALCHIPIIVLTSSQAPGEVARAYASGAAAYCLKPLELDEYFALVRLIATFWGRQVLLAH